MNKWIKRAGIALLVLIAILFAAIALIPNQVISKEEAREKLSSPYSHFLNWKGAQIHYTDEGSGFPVVMVHGFGGSYTNFEPLADLMKDNYRVICVDLPGFGLSDFPEVKEGENYLQDYRDYVTFLLDTLHLDSLYMIGNSMGGGVTWMAAADHPDKIKKIVLLDPAGYDAEKIAGKLVMFKFKSVRKIFAKGMPLFMSRQGMQKAYYHDDRVKEDVVKTNNMFTNREGNIPHMLNLALSKQFPDTTRIAKVQCPALIVWGTEDEIIPLEHATRFERDIPGSKVELFDKCGHCPMMEMPKETADACEKFFGE